MKRKSVIYNYILIISLCCMFSVSGFSQNAVHFLNDSPDARGSSLGNSGVSSSSDANSQYWNVAKYANNPNKYGGSVSFVPWFSDFSNNVYLGSVTGFLKPSPLQAISLSIRYLNLGKVDLRDINNTPQGSFNPEEYALDIGYSRMLWRYLSMGACFRYISSDIIPNSLENYSNGHGVSCDLALFFSKPINLFSGDQNLSIGLNLSNIGQQIKYSGGSDNSQTHIPTVVRIGSTIDFLCARDNHFSVSIESNKERSMSISNSLGLEYSYSQLLFLRAGLYRQGMSYDNISYMSFGIGFTHQSLLFNLAYLIASGSQSSPMSNTLSISVCFNIPN